MLDLSLPRFPAKAINREVMKLTLEPEEGGGLVTGAGTQAPPGVERDEKHRPRRSLCSEEWKEYLPEGPPGLR